MLPDAEASTQGHMGERRPDSARLAREFDVSTLAMEVRLNQTRINATHDKVPHLSDSLRHALPAMVICPLSPEGCNHVSG
jgi:hypothetical protein